MLILSRKIGEKIAIGDDVWITVTKIERGRVRLGFEAPPGTRIHRQEIVERLRQMQGAEPENQEKA
jgi:carbon storage regulator